MTSSKIKTTPSTTKTNTEEGKAVQTLPAPPVGFLAAYHPLFIEGPGKNHDKRDPEIAATKILSALKKLWAGTKMTKPVILITQGDPLAPTGISIISQKIAEGLGIQRLLVCLDEDMDPVHIERADRDGVVYEWKYSDLTRILNDKSPGTLKRIEDGIDEEIELKNERRGETLDSWYRDFALLQEITKAVMKAEVGELTMAHTVPNSEIKDNSVTSFYKVGLDLHIVEKEELVEYPEFKKSSEKVKSPAIVVHDPDSPKDQGRIQRILPSTGLLALSLYIVFVLTSIGVSDIPVYIVCASSVFSFLYTLRGDDRK